MLLKRTGITYSRKKENLLKYVMKDIAHHGWLYKGFRLSFYVCTRERKDGR